jgi:hypothetical protein
MDSTATVHAEPSSELVLRLPDLSALFRAVERWFKSAKLSAEEVATLGFAIKACSVAGTRVLAAGDREDLDEQIEAVLRDPEYYSSLVRLFGAGARPGETQPLPSARGAEEHAAVLMAALGEGALLPALKGFRYLLVISDVASRITTREPSTVELQAFLTRSVENPLWFVTDPATSVHGARALLASLKMLVCLFTVGLALLTGHRPEPWLAYAVAEHWQNDTYALLRYVASVPGSEVSEDVVPVSDRYDLSKLAEDEQRARRRIDELFHKAEPSA